MTGFLVILFLAAFTGLYIWKRKDKENTNTTATKKEDSTFNDFDLEWQIQQEMKKLKQKRKLKEEENAKLEEESRLKRIGAFALPAPVASTEKAVMEKEEDVVDGNSDSLDADISISNEATLIAQENTNDTSLPEVAATSYNPIEVTSKNVVVEELRITPSEHKNLEVHSITETKVTVNEKQAEIVESVYNPSSKAISKETLTSANTEVFKNQELPPTTTVSQVLKSGHTKVTGKKAKKTVTK